MGSGDKIVANALENEANTRDRGCTDANCRQSVIDFRNRIENPVIQYLTAASRDAAALTALQDPLQPAVLWTIRRVVESARARGLPVDLCCEMAGDEPSELALDHREQLVEALGRGPRCDRERPGLLERRAVRVHGVGEAAALPYLLEEP